VATKVVMPKIGLMMTEGTIVEWKKKEGDQIKKGEIAMVINTPTDAYSQADSYYLRRCALDYQVPYYTTIAGAEAAAEGIEYLKQREFDVQALQDYGAVP